MNVSTGIGRADAPSGLTIHTGIRGLTRALPAALLLLIMAGCNEGTSSGDTTTTNPAPTVTLSANPGTVSPGAAATLNWNATDATSCTASGGWSGVLGTSGSQNTGSLSATSTYSLNCTGTGGSTRRDVTVTVQAPATGTADLSWYAPSTNVDDSPLTDLAGFNIYRGTSASNLQRIASVSASERTYRATNLSSGTHYFAVTATNLAGAESARSNIGSKSFP